MTEVLLKKSAKRPGSIRNRALPYLSYFCEETPYFTPIQPEMTMRWTSLVPS